MAREKEPEPKADDIPAWFMTYSDVITLLMTFFILLLTFASQEPEEFERMKLAVFGGGGSDGIAGKKKDALERDSITVRHRPEVSRLTQQGSVAPPMYVDTERDGMGKSLKMLDEHSDLAKFQRVTFTSLRSTILDQSGELTQMGLHQMKTLATQVIHQNMKLQIAVTGDDNTLAAVKMAQQMSLKHKVPLGRVAVVSDSGSADNIIRFTISRESF